MTYLGSFQLQGELVIHERLQSLVVLIVVLLVALEVDVFDGILVG